MQSSSHLLLPNGDGQGLSCVFDVRLCLCGSERERGSVIEIDGRDRKSMRELSVPVCMVILGHMSNNHTALNGKATQEGG